MMRALCIFALVVFSVSLFSSRAHAETALVVLVRPPAQSAIVNEAIMRIRGELVADGFGVLVVDAPPGAEPASVLARADQQPSAAATIGLFLHTDAKVAEVWVVDRLTRKTVTRSIEMNASAASTAPEVLARRSVELLRASLLEVLVEAKEQPTRASSPRAQASRWAQKSLEPRGPRFGLEVGVQLLGGFGGIGSSLMPVGRLRLTLSQRFAARLTLSGLGTRPRVEGAIANATVSQALGLLEVTGDIVPESWLRPFLSLGAGSYHIGVEGSASSPYTGLRGERFVLALDAGAGLAVDFNSTFALSLEGHATALTPYPVIRFLEAGTVTLRNPRVSIVLAMVVQL